MKLTILWHSVSPFCGSGYGKITRYITKGFADNGHRVVISAYYGIEPGQQVVLSPNLIMVGSKEGPFGVLSSKMYADMFRTDVSFLATDWWAFPDFPRLHPRSILYSPMDSEEYDINTYAFTKLYWKIVVFSKHSENDLIKHGIHPVAFIPHGVDLTVYKPLNKQECREHFKYPVEDFIFGMVAANNDKEDRKNFTGTLKAFKYLLEQEPDLQGDVKLVIYTPPNNPSGMPIASLVRKLNLERNVYLFPDNLFSIGLPEEEMAKLYNTFDVHVLASVREGFGLPVLESQACGIPNIVHDYAAAPELVRGHGWLVKSLTVGEGNLNRRVSPINSEYHIPDNYDLYLKMKEAVSRPDLVTKYGIEARKFAVQYNWDDLIKYKWLPFLDQVAEEIESFKMVGFTDVKMDKWREKIAKYI